MKKLKPPRAWAYEFDGQLCHWARASKAQLEDEGLPMAGAKPVMVRLVKEHDYQQLKKDAGTA